MKTASQVLHLVNTAIETMPLDRKPQGLYEPVRYVLSLGGKRIRPVLMLMGYGLYHDDIDTIMPTALGIEVYHNYTLLHDDVMDKADLRRGRPTVHRVWNETAAILSGDAMLVLAYQLMQQTAPRHLAPVLSLFTETALQIGEGQQYDVEFESRLDVTETEYLEMIRLKTSVLLAAALRIGAIQADAPESDAQALYHFGENLGLAFQIQDDLLDVYGDPATFGKKIGGDILCNKKTFLLIHALQGANARQRCALMQWLDTTDAEPHEKIDAVTALYDAVGVRATAEKAINAHFLRALEALDQVAVAPERKTALRDLAFTLLGRQS